MFLVLAPMSGQFSGHRFLIWWVSRSLETSAVSGITAALSESRSCLLSLTFLHYFSSVGSQEKPLTLG